MEYDHKDILTILPHKQPFLFVDRARVDEETGIVTGRKCVAASEPFFQGHFPGHPIMPGALICEAMAQVGGVALQYPEENRGLIPMFTGMDKVRFRSPVRPGDQLVTKAVIKKIVGRMGKVHCECYVGETFKASADFLFYLAEPENKKEKDENNKYFMNHGNIIRSMIFQLIPAIRKI